MNLMPGLPFAACAVFFAVFFTLLNLRGIEASTRTNAFIAACLGVVIIASAECTPSLRASQQAAPMADEQTSVDELLKSANALLKQQQGDRALPLFQRALAEARRLGLEPQQADALCGIGEIQYYITQYPASREHGREALAIYERLASQEGQMRATARTRSARSRS